MTIQRLATVFLLTFIGCGFSTSDRGSDSPDTGTELDAGIDAAQVLQPDAGRDAGPDAPVELTLAQTSGITITQAIGTSCTQPDNTTRDGTWYRVFPLSAAFHAIAVTFGISSSDSATVQVKIGTYSGSIGGSTLTTSAISWSDVEPSAIPDSAAAQYITVPVDAAISGSALIVAIAAPNQQVTGGNFHLGFTQSGESMPGYFSSTSCNPSTPTSTMTLGANGHAVIQVIGFEP